MWFMARRETRISPRLERCERGTGSVGKSLSMVWDDHRPDPCQNESGEPIIAR
jgi:hypothetical protein